MMVVDASMSTDPDGGSVTCLFDYELENGTVESTVSTNCLLERHWENDGEYLVNLSVLDDEGDVDRVQF